MLDTDATRLSQHPRTSFSNRFLRGPADAEPDKRVKIKVSRLQVVDCSGNRQPFVTIDIRCLHELLTNFRFLAQVDWLLRSTLTTLFVIIHGIHPGLTEEEFMEQLNVTRQIQASRSLRGLAFSVEVDLIPAQDVLRRMLDDPAWSVPESLLMWVHSLDSEAPTDVSWTPSSSIKRLFGPHLDALLGLGGNLVSSQNPSYDHFSLMITGSEERRSRPQKFDAPSMRNY